MKKDQTLTIGLPRALLYYRYQGLWRGFFEQLGAKVIVSPPTDRKIMEEGAALAVDETCLSAKIFFGHVKALMGQCDYILVPRISSSGYRQGMCPRFQALPDQTRNVFRPDRERILSYDLDVPEGREEKDEFIRMGRSLGCSHKAAKRAYRRTMRAERKRRRQAVAANERLYKTEGLKILIAAHSYLIEDAYIGKTVLDFLRESGVTPIRADVVDRSEALRRSDELSPTCKWAVSREILGSIAMHKDKVDGIILLSAFPCGPDSMVNELLTRKVKGVPMLNLVLDGQSGTAGIETRLESFVDIIRFKEGML